MKPHMTPKRMLVHPKDKCTPQKNSVVVYQVPCKDCQYVYTREMERRQWVREKEHKIDVKTLEEKKYTRLRKKGSLTDHVAKGEPHHRLGGCEVP